MKMPKYIAKFSFPTFELSVSNSFFLWLILFKYELNPKLLTNFN